MLSHKRWRDCRYPNYGLTGWFRRVLGTAEGAFKKPKLDIRNPQTETQDANTSENVKRPELTVPHPDSPYGAMDAESAWGLTVRSQEGVQPRLRSPTRGALKQRAPLLELRLVAQQSSLPPSMLLGNSSSSAAAFFLAGVPSLQAAHSWLGLLFCSMYLVAVLGNGALLVAIRLVQALHRPMFYFLGMLGATDLVMATAVVPKMLSVFWVGAPQISFDACFAQMFLIHAMTAVESGVLLAMAVDRYLAICHLLRYEALLTPRRAGQIGLAVLVRGVAFMAPLTWMVRRLPYCASTVIRHSYCEHMAVMSLACADPTASRVYNLVGSSLIVGADTAFIAVSYGLILRAVAKLTEKAAQLKAFSTCSSHLCVLSLYYLPGMASIYIQRFPRGVPPHVQVLLANLYLTLPPALNPLIYGRQMKPVWGALGKVLPFLRAAAGSPRVSLGREGGPP
ncbi:hypothetical protein lerEdw1_005778 [Lerista edwardsae]|nr:hypothetical protein lerEdw1_005778 [Lerista edwardsae]